MKSLIIVGNAPIDIDLSETIDAYDCVVRFNNCKNYNVNSGKKTDILILNNVGNPSSNKTLEFMLKDRTEVEIKKELPYLENVKQVWFIRPSTVFLYDFYKNNFSKENDIRNSQLKSLQLKRNLVTEIINSQKISKEKVTIISEKLYTNTWRKLQYYGSSNAITPSTGALGIEMLLAESSFDEYEKYIIGFGWKGWKGHPWQQEKMLIDDYINKGSLKFLKIESKLQSDNLFSMKIFNIFSISLLKTCFQYLFRNRK